MASQSSLSIIFLTVLLAFFSFIQAQSPTSPAPEPAPAPAGPPNIITILEKARQYNIFIRILQQTATADQINNQVNNSHYGMTVFAPTDNAFHNLRPGTINTLTDQELVQLIQYHIVPKFYNIQSLRTVSNPVRTQASGQDGRLNGLYFTGDANNQDQVHVSVGYVSTTIFNALSQTFPLAVYQVDKFLLPVDSFRNAFANSTAPSPLALTSAKGGSNGAGKTISGEVPSSAPAPSTPALTSPKGGSSGPGKITHGEVPSSAPVSSPSVLTSPKVVSGGAGKTTPGEMPSSSPSGSRRIAVGILSLGSGIWLANIYLFNSFS